MIDIIALYRLVQVTILLCLKVTAEFQLLRRVRLDRSLPHLLHFVYPLVQRLESCPFLALFATDFPQFRFLLRLLFPPININGLAFSVPPVITSAHLIEPCTIRIISARLHHHFAKLLRLSGIVNLVVARGEPADRRQIAVKAGIDSATAADDAATAP